MNASHVSECFTAALAQLVANAPDRITSDLRGEHCECGNCGGPLINATCDYACNGADSPLPLCVECSDGAILSGYAVRVK